MILAICPHCAKNIQLASDSFEDAECPFCEGNFSAELLRMKNAFINVEEANKIYDIGKQSFTNGDFREAITHYKKALELNQNHYLSFYYSGLCEIYENANNPGNDKVMQLLRLLKYSLVKLDSAQPDINTKKQFALAIIHEIHMMVKVEFENVFMHFSESNGIKPVRYRLIQLAKYVASFVSIGKDMLVTFDPEIANEVLQLTNMAIFAIIKSTMSVAPSDAVVNAPTDEEYDVAKKIYDSLEAFILTLDPSYTIENHKPDFSALVQFNKETVLHIKKYYDAIGPKNRKRYLSIKGEFLKQLTVHCDVAAQYTFFMLHRNLYYNSSDPLRKEMLVQAINFCFELLYPRIEENSASIASFSAVPHRTQLSVAPYLEVFLAELDEKAKKLTQSSMEDFWAKAYAMTNFHYENMSKMFAPKIDSKKLAADKELQRYSKFLCNIIIAASMGLSSTIEYPQDKNKDRIALLKVGEKAANEFFMLHNYQFAEMRKYPPYAEVVMLYNEIESELENGGKKKKKSS